MTNSQFYIGLMSGTSLDRIDAVLVDFAQSPLKIIGIHHEPIPSDLKQLLLSFHYVGENEIYRWGCADVQMGLLLAKACLSLLKKVNIKSLDIVAIGSHGQTIRHHPDSTYPFTLQIGDPNIIAEQTKITTVSDFRRRDMAQGGQGAPLVPAFHESLFRTSVNDRVIVNIGGIANITILPCNSLQPVTGFDTGPGNALIDAWAKRHLHQEFDDKGRWGAQGNSQSTLLSAFLADPYFQKKPPKSTGKEYFNEKWITSKLSDHFLPEDVQRTLVELTALSITQAIDHYSGEKADIFMCGGGVHNDSLVLRLRESNKMRYVDFTSALGLHPEWVEATAFAWLAKQTMEKKTGNLPHVTGAKKPVVLGGVYYTHS